MKTHILIICRHPDILQTIIRLVNNNEQWQATGVVSDEEAINAFTAQKFELVLLGSGIEPASEALLRDIFEVRNPDCKIAQHYGGGSGLLAAEIYQALG